MSPRRYKLGSVEARLALAIDATRAPWTVPYGIGLGSPIQPLFRTDAREFARLVAEGYEAWLLGESHAAHCDILPPPPDLRPVIERNLACRCPLSWPHGPLWCHADVLLRVASLHA